jgi:predicted hydrolase (HD superfamily)
MKQKSFAAAVSREDMERGAADLGIDFSTHVQFVIDAMSPHADLLGLGPRGA